MTDFNVFVIVLTYNSVVSLPRCIISIFSQTIGSGEVIIIDDRSTNNSIKVIEIYAGQIVFISQANQGAAVTKIVDYKSQQVRMLLKVWK